MNRYEISFKVNGELKTMEVEPELLLVDLLREHLGLTGAKVGCREGDCGACTVLVDGKACNSCLILAVEIDGKEITTIEGLGDYDKLHPLQQAFIEEGAVQCGFCTPGMVLSAKALLDQNANPSEEEIRRAISGNLCRCTGYSKIVSAIARVAGINGAGEKEVR